MAPKKSSGPAPKFPWEIDHGFPDFQTQTKAWVEATDKRVKERFNPSRPIEYDIWHDQPSSSFEEMINEDVLQEIIDSRRTTCSSQLRLSQLITAMLTEKDFDSKWKALGPEVREKHMLGALRHTEANHPNLPSSLGEKLNCPEITWDALTRDGGRGFLDLMQLFLLDDNSKPPSRPFTLENARFNKMIGWDENDKHESRKAWLGMARLLRTSYISSVVEVTIANYNGFKVETVKFTHEKHKTKEVLQQHKPMLNNVLGPSGSKAYRREQADDRKEMQLFCSNCMKIEKKDDGGKMSICSKCNAIGRQVRYCSRECQKAAWKDHKRDCGKPLSVSSALDDVTPIQRRGSQRPPLRKDIPPPDPSYKRSADLLRLIEYLNEWPDCDYIVIVPVPDRPPSDPDLLSVKLDEVQGAATFMCMRNRAMRNGDMAALLYIFRVLHRLGEIEAVRIRLELEYGAPFRTLLKDVARGSPPAVPRIKVQEVIEALTYLKTTKRFDHELSSFDPAAPGATVTLGMQVGPNRDLSAQVEFPEFVMPPMMDLTPITRTYKRNHAKVKGGPNQHIPATEAGYKLTPALESQKQSLQENPMADYVLYGQQEAPDTPQAATFVDFKACMGFLSYRSRLFRFGGEDLDGLAYFIMTLEPSVRRKKIPRDALLAQLKREYGDAAVDEVVSRIKGDKYVRDGREFAVGEIPAARDGFVGICPQLKEVERFEEILRRATNLM